MVKYRGVQKTKADGHTYNKNINGVLLIRPKMQKEERRAIIVKRTSNMVENHNVIFIEEVCNKNN